MQWMIQSTFKTPVRIPNVPNSGSKVKDVFAGGLASKKGGNIGRGDWI